MNQKTSKVEKEFYLRCSYLTLSVLFDKEPKNKKNRPESLLSFHYNQTHGGTCLVLLPSRPDTLHKPTIVLAFRQRIVYLIFHSLTSLFLISFFAGGAFGKSQSKSSHIRLLKCHLLHMLGG